MDGIAEIQSEIKAVKFALKSFAQYRDDHQRQDYLRSNFDVVLNLDTYFGFSQDKLAEFLDKLQGKENLLLAKLNGEDDELCCHCEEDVFIGMFVIVMRILSL